MKKLDPIVICPESQKEITYRYKTLSAGEVHITSATCPGGLACSYDAHLGGHRALVSQALVARCN